MEQNKEFYLDVAEDSPKVMTQIHKHLNLEKANCFLALLVNLFLNLSIFTPQYFYKLHATKNKYFI